MTLIYKVPTDNNLIPIPVINDTPEFVFFLEHRDGQTLVWAGDWWDQNHPTPAAVLPGEASPEAMSFWVAGWAAGTKHGFDQGRPHGFSECQAGFRALLGAAAATDVTTLLTAARSAGRNG